ncbi:phosphate acyltransferase PlsX [bacterium]|nr:phosphate acyltransferase PlsX [bacterium]QQR60237.1 MAG: phosphate acyltransferase PlsX [Candidatus Melainabacteria bacterium]
MRIAIDAMGGDHAPREVVLGAVIAAKEYGIAIQLVGPPDVISAELKRNSVKEVLGGRSPESMNISIVAATEVVEMGEKPSRAVLKKKDSSILVATKQVAKGEADGVVAAGSTGAAAVAAQIALGKLQGADKAAICVGMPTVNNEPCLLLDGGASVDCSPEELFHFGVMGSVLFKGLYNTPQPRVGLLNIGTEETKGNDLVRDAYKIFSESNKLNFIGFVEGRDYPLGKVDVVVTDGFTGNVSLKTAEGIARMMSQILRQELMSSIRGKVAGIMAEPYLKALKARVDHNELGGALLLGVKGVYVIAHGGSKHTAIKNAIRVAKDMVMANVIKKMEQALKTESTGNGNGSGHNNHDNNDSSGDSSNDPDGKKKVSAAESR